MLRGFRKIMNLQVDELFWEVVSNLFNFLGRGHILAPMSTVPSWGPLKHLFPLPVFLIAPK